MYANQYDMQPRAAVGSEDIFAACWRRKWLILVVMLICIGAAILVSRLMRPTWRADAQLILIERPGLARASSADYTAPIAETIETQTGMLQTAEMTERALNWLKNRSLLAGNPEEAQTIGPDELQRAITIYNPRGSNLINIDVDAHDRGQSLALDNAVAQAFIQWKNELAQKDIQESANVLARQTEAARTRMNTALQKQLAYQTSHHVVSAPDQERAAIEQLQARQTDLAAVQQDMAAVKARLATLELQLKGTNNEIRISGGFRDDNLTLGLQSQLTQAEMDRSDQAARVTPYYPNILGPLDARIKELKARLAKAVAGTLRGQIPSLQLQTAQFQDYKQAQVTAAFTQARLDAATKLVDESRNQMNSLPQMGSITTDLARQADMATAHYVALQSSLDATMLDKSKINGNVQITQAAIAPESPYKPNLMLNLMLGTLLGLFLSFITVLLIEQTDHRLRRDEQVELLGAGTLLGALPQLSRAEITGIPQGQLPPPAAEACRLTQANLLRVMGHSLPGQCRIILITSALPGEGKSVAAAEFARSLARSGKRIILVDANLREPAQDKLFAATAAAGLAEVLAGQIELDAAVTASETRNLSVLFSGGISDNPVDFIGSPQMAELIKNLRSRADMVIIDAPSCSVVDPLILAPASDYVMLVVGLGRTDEDAVRSTVSALSGSAPVGIFINRTRRKNVRAYEAARAFSMTEALTKDSSGIYSKPVQSAAFERTMVMHRDSLTSSRGPIGIGDRGNTHGSESLDITVPVSVKEKK